MNRLATAGLVLAAVSTLAMMLIGALDVLATYLLNRPVPAAVESIEMLMVIIVFLSMAYAQSRRQHIAVDLLYTRFPAPVKRGVTLLIRILGLAFFGVLAWQGWELFGQSWAIREYASGIIPFPVYPSKACLALGATLMALQCAHDLLVSPFDPGGMRTSSAAGEL